MKALILQDKTGKILRAFRSPVFDENITKNVEEQVRDFGLGQTITEIELVDCDEDDISTDIMRHNCGDEYVNDMLKKDATCGFSSCNKPAVYGYRLCEEIRCAEHRLSEGNDSVPLCESKWWANPK